MLLQRFFRFKFSVLVYDISSNGLFRRKIGGTIFSVALYNSTNYYIAKMAGKDYKHVLVSSKPLIGGGSFIHLGRDIELDRADLYRCISPYEYFRGYKSLCRAGLRSELGYVPKTIYFKFI